MHIHILKQALGSDLVAEIVMGEGLSVWQFVWAVSLN